MDLTAGTRATAVTAAVVMTAGLAVIFYGIVRGDPAHSISGVALTTTALTLIALLVIKRWVTDTADERRQLATATQAAQDEREKYFAAQTVLENDQQRLLRDAAADRARAEATLIAEREAMAAEFEEKRASLICETLATVAELMQNQKDQPCGSVIQFPTQQSVRVPEQERSRGHNVVGP
jgi:hypothetical protein